MKKPSKDNIEEPIISPVRQNYNDKNFVQKFIAWRTHNRHFIFRKDYIIWVESIQLWVKIPAGFVFDGASVPKMLQSIITSVDSLFYGSILHDFIYRTKKLIVCTDVNFGYWFLLEVEKEKADDIMASFSDQMEGIKAPNAIVKNILGGVGWVAWKLARKRNMTIYSAYPSMHDKTLNYYN